MNSITATLLGVFLCIGWPLIWVAIALYLQRYGSPVAWRGLFRRREESDEE